MTLEVFWAPYGDVSQVAEISRWICAQKRTNTPSNDHTMKEVLSRQYSCCFFENLKFFLDDYLGDLADVRLIGRQRRMSGVSR